MPRNRAVLMVALGIDNFGSGLFLPLPILYATRVAGLSLGLAGTVITAGTAIGLLVPPVAGRLADRFGPRAVVIAAQLLQAAGAATYFLAGDAVSVLLAALLLAAGQQAFFSSVFALIADTAGAEPTDRTFAQVGMVRSACFGLGGLVVGAGLSGAGTAGLRIAVAADSASFVVAALLLLRFLRVPHVRHERTPATVGVLRNRPYLALIATSMLIGLTVDFFMVGNPVYVLEILHGPAWLPGAMITVLTLVASVGGTTAVRLTRRLARTTSMAWGAALQAVWCLTSLAAGWLPSSWLPAFLLANVLVLATANLLAARANALAEAAAPRELRGQYLAAFQYAFTAAGIAAPAVVALFSMGAWVPWTVSAAAAACAAIGLPILARFLPRHAVLAQEPALAQGP